MFHSYNVKGDTGSPTEIVPATQQREVLAAAVDTGAGGAELPESLLVQLTPHPNSNLEDMSSDYAFDHPRAARILAAMVLGDLLTPDRAARLVAFADRQANVLTLLELVDAVVAATWARGRPRRRRRRRCGASPSGRRSTR